MESGTQLKTVHICSVGKVLVNPKVFLKLNIVLISNKKYPEKLLKGTAKKISSQVSLLDQGMYLKLGNSCAYFGQT